MDCTCTRFDIGRATVMLGNAFSAEDGLSVLFAHGTPLISGCLAETRRRAAAVCQHFTHACQINLSVYLEDTNDMHAQRP